MQENEKKGIFKKISVAERFDKIQGNLGALVTTVIFALILMALSTCAIFFIRIKGAEQVLVPNVVGLQLEDAIIEMQAKELYPKIKLRYTDSNTEKGLVMEQSPSAGGIVKGYSTVTLTVSRGEVQATVEDYVGKNASDLNIGDELSLENNNQLISFEPIYKYSEQKEGQIIAQFPKKDTQVFSKTQVSVVVSKGPTKKNIELPSFVGMSVNDFCLQAGKLPVIFEATSHAANDDETPGTVTFQSAQTSLEYAKVNIDFAFPTTVEEGSENTLTYGLFQDSVEQFPVPVKMKLESVTEEGERTVLYSFSHTGGDISIPYVITKGSTLVFSVNNKEKFSQLIG